MAVTDASVGIAVSICGTETYTVAGHMQENGGFKPSLRTRLMEDLLWRL